MWYDAIFDFNKKLLIVKKIIYCARLLNIFITIYELRFMKKIYKINKLNKDF